MKAFHFTTALANQVASLHWLCWVNSPGYVSLLRRGRGHEVQAWKLGPVNSYCPLFTLHMNVQHLVPGQGELSTEEITVLCTELASWRHRGLFCCFLVCSSD